MKKLSFLLAALLITGSICAQTTYQRHELWIGYGLLPVASIPDYDMPDSSGAGGNAHYVLKNSKNYGGISVGYLFHLSEPLAIGVTYSRTAVNAGDIVLGSSEAMGTIGKQKINVFMVTAKYQWLKKNDFSFYSRIAIGSRSIEDAEPEFGYQTIEREFEGMEFEGKKDFAWQVVPIGMDWHFMPNLALFAEAGAGVTGCFMAGAKVTF